MKRILKITLSVLVLIIAVVIGGLVWLGLRLRDAEPNPNTPAGRQRLQTMAQTAQPLLAALKSYRHDHSHYPASLAVLYPHYMSVPVQSPDSTWKGWYYFVDPTAPSPQEYSLSFSIGIDPTLHYKHQKYGAQWYYDPGTGAATTNLPFMQSG